MYGVAKTSLAAKKKSLHSAERDSERVVRKRVEYAAQIEQLEVRRFKFLDEAGSNLAMTSQYGRAAPGERVIESVPKNYGENISMLATISLGGIDAPMTISGAVDGLVFVAYVKEVLCPSLAEGDVVVMDNLAAHKVKGVR